MASRLAKRSKISFSTSRWRSSGRSILLMTTMGRRPRFKALETTNLVCGSGPSEASTSTTTPSTMFRMRSTSPPKSAWPGVSTILMRVSFHRTEVHLARMVMPRSRSRSLESIAALSHPLALAERAGLLQQLVDERGLAVVDVGDDRDVSELHQRLCAAQKMRGPSTSRSRPPARGFYPDRCMACGAGCRATGSRPRWRARRWETAPPARM